MSLDQVIKRDNTIVPFDRKRIENAIYAAARDVGNGEGRQWAETMSWAVVGLLQERFGDRNGNDNGRIPHVEEIQDIVEEVLIKSGSPQVAKAYILYRQKHAEMRAARETLMDTDRLVDSYLERTDWRVNENSNMNYSLQGLNFYVSSSIAARYWLHKIYPPEVQQAHVEGDFHLHDLGTLSTYTYYGKEAILVKDDSGIQLTSFEKLYAESPEPEVVLNEADGAFAKHPKNCFVLDKSGWTRIVRLVRKRKERAMRFIKNRGGRSVIVTDNHPMITQRGERVATDVHAGEDALYTVDPRPLLAQERLFFETEIDLLAELKRANVTRFGRDHIYLNGIPITDIDPACAEGGLLHTYTQNIARKIPLTAEMGYFVGFTLAEGYLSYDSRSACTISINQKDAAPLHAINQALIALGAPGCISIHPSTGICELHIKNVFLRFLFEHIFRIAPGARHKTLPVHILHYNLDFVKGLLAGVIDGDGSIDGNGACLMIRVSARTLLEQMAYLLQLLGATPRDRNIEGVGTRRTYKGREIVQNFPLYGLSFRKTAALTLPSSKFQATNLSARAWQDETRDEWHRVVHNQLTDIPDNDIYDITTETGTLIVNGMWNHNCCGWDLQDLLLQGFGGVTAKVQSKPPRHLRTALGQLVNFFYTLQGESAGAVAVSNFDTLMAPFIRYDRLDYAQVKQAVQEFVFNINVPTRVGFQCMSEDTEILAQDGWKSYDQVHEGDLIATFNVQGRFIEYLPVRRIFAREYKGKMYHLHNRISDQLISPGHRVVVKNFDSNEYALVKIEDVIESRASFIVPTLNEGNVEDVHVDSVAEVDYTGVIWCPSTENETVVARRNGKIFITGNTPFTNVTMDLTPSPVLSEQPVIIAGEAQRECYGDFQREMDMFNRAFAEVMLEGDAQGRVFTFPIPTYNITRDFAWENPNLEPVWAMTSRYGIPYFANFVNSDMRPEDARSMCCRLRLDNRELHKRIGGLFAAAPLTGSVGVVTINMPRLAYQACEEDEFFERLEHLMETARVSLEIKRELLEFLTAQGLYPYCHHYLHSVKQRFGGYWNNHFSTIGLIGMNEACLNMLGVGIAHPDGKAFAVRTLQFMRDVLARFQRETGHLYNLEATPAEGASYRLARADKGRFSDIITSGVAQTPYYTNSTQLPVAYSDDLFEVLEHQDELQTLYTGGTVLHIFLGEQLDDWRQARRLVRRVAENFHLPYYTLTPTFSVCPVHGYIPGAHTYCPYPHTEDELTRFGRAVKKSS